MLGYKHIEAVLRVALFEYKDPYESTHVYEVLIMYTDIQEKILRLPDVQMKTGIARSTIYGLMAKGKFPKAIPLTSRSVGWLESEVNEWIVTRRFLLSE